MMVDLFAPKREDKLKIYTIGYGLRPMDVFLTILQGNGIDLLVDIRTKPYSRNPQFILKNLTASLKSRNIELRWFGPKLGGIGGLSPDDWRKALPEVIELAKENTIVIMCAEKDVNQCHRLQIGEMLRDEHGCEIVHL
jgi:uncharacterized protein (DUF488 family)